MRDLPEGLEALDRADGVYRYTEDADHFDPGFVDFIVHPDGIEVASAGAPFVPREVLRWIADLSEGKSNAAGG